MRELILDALSRGYGLSNLFYVGPYFRANFYDLKERNKGFAFGEDPDPAEAVRRAHAALPRQQADLFGPLQPWERNR